MASPSLPGLRTPRPSRRRNPPRLYTPGNRNETRNYQLNAKKARGKKQAAANRESVVQLNKAGNIVITLNTATYEMYHNTMLQHIEDLKNETQNTLEIEKRHTKDKNGIETEITIHIKK